MVYNKVVCFAVGNLFLADLDFADDIVILGSTQTALRDLTMAQENQAASAGLHINGQKTKVVCIDYVNSRVPITIDGKKVEEVANFTYLGSIVSSNGDEERDVICCVPAPLSNLELAFPHSAD